MSEEICGFEYKTKEGVCDNPPKYSDGRCGFHTEEDTTFQESRTAGNEKHGLYKSEYYEGQPDRDQQWIDIVSDDLLEKSRYTEEDESMVEKCRQIAIDLHQKRRADGYIAKKGLTQENTVGVHEDYGEITETQENTLFITKDRLSRESRLSMKDLGILDEDSSKTEEAAKSLVESLSEDIE
jgi:hypothetical protein